MLISLSNDIHLDILYDLTLWFVLWCIEYIHDSELHCEVYELAQALVTVIPQTHNVLESGWLHPY